MFLAVLKEIQLLLRNFLVPFVSALFLEQIVRLEWNISYIIKLQLILHPVSIDFLNSLLPFPLPTDQNVRMLFRNWCPMLSKLSNMEANTMKLIWLLGHSAFSSRKMWVPPGVFLLYLYWTCVLVHIRYLIKNVLDFVLISIWWKTIKTWAVRGACCPFYDRA